MEGLAAPAPASSRLGHLNSAEIRGPRRKTVEHGRGCVAETNVSATGQSRGDELPMRGNGVIRLFAGVRPVPHFDQFAGFHHPGQTVVGLSLATQRAGQPHAIVHRLSTTQEQTEQEASAKSVDTASAVHITRFSPAQPLPNLVAATEDSRAATRFARGCTARGWPADAQLT